ncbi:doxx family protein [Eudoraea sp.]|uniref:doxx family protein n=1 Tax=Eudoraea sp. TaxID=1979955 RepID=UPI003C711080
MRELVIGYWRKRNKFHFVPFSIGVVYLWFGALKFFSGLSPAEELAKSTIDKLTLGLLPAEFSIVLLAFWETLIGVLLIANILEKPALKMALVHITLTFSPFLFFSEALFAEAPFALTLLGQYIIKNVIILGVLLVLLRESKKRQF